MPETSLQTAFATILEELGRLLPAGTEILDAHTHLGNDEDGSSLRPEGLLAHLDAPRRAVSPPARPVPPPPPAPDRVPAYRRPNDRVLDWAADSGGRIIPY